MRTILLIIAACGALSATATDQATTQTPQRVTVHAEYTYGYLLTLPPGYDNDTARRWPLLVFLHGMGERGADLDLVRRHGVPRYLDKGHTLPFIVVAPQCPDDEYWNPPALEAFITEMCRRHRVDPERVYLTGLSMGGFGVWALAARHPERYAAVIPICGGGETRWAPRLRDLPIWAFHGAMDKTVPAARSQDMIDAIEAAGGSPQLTIYPDAGHDSWTATYNNAAIYTWLLEHKRGANAPAPTAKDNL